MSRVRQTFGEKNEWGNPVVEVRGPHNRASNQWYLTMLPLAGEITLSWRNNPERARRELAALRAALDFIESQLGLEATG